MLTIFKGTYIVFGETVEPRVVLLTQRQDRELQEGLALCEKYPKQKGYLLGQIFAKGVDTIFPAWTEELLTSIATGYEGIHWQRVRQLAAAIVLNITFEELDKNPGKGQPGAGDRKPKVPVNPKPLGSAVKA